MLWSPPPLFSGIIWLRMQLVPSRFKLNANVAPDNSGLPHCPEVASSHLPSVGLPAFQTMVLESWRAWSLGLFPSDTLGCIAEMLCGACGTVPPPELQAANKMQTAMENTGVIFRFKL